MEIQTIRKNGQSSLNPPNFPRRVGNVNIGKELQINNTPVLNVTNNNTTRGPYNPIISIIRNAGKNLTLDVDFNKTQNSYSFTHEDAPKGKRGFYRVRLLE